MTHNTRRPRLRSAVSAVAAILLGTAGMAAPAVAAEDNIATVDPVVLEDELDPVPSDSEEATPEGNTDASELTSEEVEAESNASESDAETNPVEEESPTEPLPVVVGGGWDLSVAAISDFHGAIRTAPVIAHMLDGLRADGETHFVSVGDSIGGSKFESAIAQDVPTIDVLNAMGLVVSAVGNHEFDQGYADLRDRVLELADFVYLGANVDDAEIEDYQILEVDGVKVAYVGAVTEDTPSLTAASATAGLTFVDPVARVNEIAGKFKDGDLDNGEADVVVALIHEGSAVVSTLGADVDLAFAGHTHVAAVTATDSGAPVCQPGASGETLAVASIERTADGTFDVSCENQVVAVDEFDKEGNLVSEAPKNAKIKALVDEKVEQSKVLGAEELFTIEGVANRGTNKGPGDEGGNRGTESSAGNLIAQAFYEYGQTLAAPADFGIMNSGGIRADFDPNGDGIVTFKESFDVQPFGNSYGTRVITGADVYELLEQQWKPGESRPILRLGLSDNVKYVYDPMADYGERILAVYIDGELLVADDTEYTVASSSFLLDAGDTFTALANAGNPVIDTGIIDNEVFNIVAKEWAEADGAVKPDYTQRSFGYTGPLTFEAGQEVTVELSSLVMTSSEPKPETVAVLIDGVEVGTADIDATITATYDESGKATVTFTVPTTSGPSVLTIKSSDGSTIDLAVTINDTAPATCEVMKPPARLAAATDRFGEATGDVYADVWAVNGAGEMHFYKGYSSGLAHVGIVDCDFQVTALAKVTDVNGDDRADFIGRHANGRLYFYYSTGDGFLQKGKQAGHGWNGMDNIVYAGKLGSSSDEYVVARQVATGHLYRYKLTRNGLTSTTKIGHGWGGMEQIVSVGDIVGNSNSDLIGIRNDGKMFAYTGQNNGTVLTYGQIGHGWKQFVDAFVPGDLTKDGKMDLVGVRGDGKMFRYANTGRGSFKPAVQIGHGWGAMELMN